MPNAQLAFRELRSPEEMASAVQLQIETWGPSDATPANQLLISVKTGGHVLGAFDGEHLAAFVYGFPAVLPGTEPWIASHMLAVRAGYGGSGLGREMKWRQRDLVLSQGFRRVTWTFDPLEARNAHLNLNLLGATAREYIVNCYGVMDDRLNRGLPSDRLMANWDLLSERTQSARTKTLAVPQVSLRVPIPSDFQSLKLHDMQQALRIRERVRGELTTALAAGHAVIGYDRVACELLLDRS